MSITLGLTPSKLLFEVSREDIVVEREFLALPLPFFGFFCTTSSSSMKSSSSSSAPSTKVKSGSSPLSVPTAPSWAYEITREDRLRAFPDDVSAGCGGGAADKLCSVIGTQNRVSVSWRLFADIRPSKRTKGMLAIFVNHHVKLPTAGAHPSFSRDSAICMASMMLTYNTDVLKDCSPYLRKTWIGRIRVTFPSRV